MSLVNGDSAAQDLLKTLCQNNGWSYSVLWCSDHQNPTILTMRNAYSEDDMKILIDNMLLQAHILGTGMVGQAVSSMMHKWIFSDEDCEVQDWKNQNVFQDDKDIHCQFSYGIETIALIPLDKQGIVQFGSTQKIYETAEFVNQARQLLVLIETSRTGCDPLDPVKLSSDSDFDGMFDSLMQCTDFQFDDSDFLNCSNPGRFLEVTCDSHDLPELFDFGPDHQLNCSSSSHPENILELDNNDPFVNFFGCHYSSNEQTHINAPISNQEFPEPSTNMDSVPTGGFSNATKNDIFDGLALGFPAQNTSLLGDIVRPRDSENCLEFCTNLDILSSERIDSILSKEEKEFFSFSISNGKPSYNNTTLDVGSSGFGPKMSKEKCLRNDIKMGKPESRPKPKDRVQVRQRIAELRKLVPNGRKISIDSLLSQTVKHMLFLEGVTKFAETLRLAEEHKDIGEFPYDRQLKMELVYVKDLNGAPGQILIEMSLDETEYFADIVEIIHGFGLILMKGNMETRGDKWWACFIVEAEANRQVTKQHIYVSLHRFLNHKASGNMNVAAGQ